MTAHSLICCLENWVHYKFGKSEVAIYFITIIMIVATNLLKGVLVGLGLSILKLLQAFSHLEIKWDEDFVKNRLELHLNGAATLIRDLESGATGPASTLVLRLDGVPFIDATAAFSLRELSASLRRRGGRLVLAQVDARVRQDLERHNLIDDLGADAVFSRLETALETLGGRSTAEDQGR